MAEKVNILQFMVVRPAELPEPAGLRRAQIRDEWLTEHGARPADLFSAKADSAIGKLVYNHVFCWQPDGGFGAAGALGNTPAGRNLVLLLWVLQTLATYEPPCPQDAHPGIVNLSSLVQRSYIATATRFYLVPDRLDYLNAPLIAALPEILVMAREAAGADPRNTFDKKRLMAAIAKRLNVTELRRAVFEGASYTGAFTQARRELFDTLYVLYILRRRYSVSLEHIIDGLRVLHLLEALAIDDALTGFQPGPVAPADQPQFNMLVALFPSLRTWNFAAFPTGFPLVKTGADVLEWLAVTPVIHPIFARLHYMKQPFNPIKPLGVGDLKVVKQWITGYKEGEIAHIDNIMLGETKTRVHRRLEKTQDVFTSTTEQEQETTRDTQTTDRFEMKRETDNVVKTDTSANAGLSVSLTYEGTGYRIMTGVTGGFAYSRSQSDQTKTATNFARDVVDKAVKRVQNRTSQQRTTTKLFETEETNKHVFSNKLADSKEHISGIYRWVDKEYKAQVFNYGKRMMFEFILPEPASFLVESRLRAYESQLQYPRPPKRPDPVPLPPWVAQLTPASINEQRYRELAERYDLSQLPPYPAQTKVVDLLDAGTGKAEFQEINISGGGGTYTARSFTCKLSSIGYRVSQFFIRGHTVFRGQELPTLFGPAPTPEDLPEPGPLGVPAPGSPPAAGEINRFEVTLAGDTTLPMITDNTRRTFLFTTGQFPTSYAVNGRYLTSEDVTLVLGFWDVYGFSLSFRVALQLTTQRLAEWQASIRAAVVRVEQERADEAYRDLIQSYNTDMATYRNRLAELRATAVNDLLQGQTEAANRQVILAELKRQCLAMLTKDFDAVTADDLLTDFDVMDSRRINVESRRFRVVETPNSDFPMDVSGNFEVVSEPVNVRLINIDKAKIKGRYIQFLEQAFEWQLLSYFLYPYFWSTPPHWVELMNRSDQTDPFFTSFLQAGSVRVLIAVTPAYDDAVLHYLATGEPWEGGPAPVIGDPLFIPLYEELKRQQDDLEGAKEDGEPWTFRLPTSLVYLTGSNTKLPEKL